MVRYLGPKIKIIRRLGILPGLTNKISKLRKKSPGEHGKRIFSKSLRTTLSGDYRERLLEKQKLKYNYGLTEKQLSNYYKKAKQKKSSTGSLLLASLESRLDCILYRLGFAPTIAAARQFITHRHILVNNYLVNIPSFLCQKGDIITIKQNIKSKKLIETFFEKQIKKREIILERLKETKLTQIGQKYLIKSLLPSHLQIESKTLEGKVLSFSKRKNVSVNVNELKVIEYYSK